MISTQKKTPTARGCARRIFALYEFLKDNKHASFSDRVGLNGSSRSEFDGTSFPDGFWVDFGDREPSVSHLITKAGRVLEHRCEYSGHNGDSYGHKYRELPEPLALAELQNISNSFERRALAAEERRLEEAANRRRAEAARKNLNARLKAKGLL